MKKFLIISAFLLAGVGAYADSDTYTTTLTNTQPATLSGPRSVSGWIDKLEITCPPASTSVIMLATFTAGGMPVDILYSNTVSATTTNAVVVARPRAIGTDSSATALTAASLLNNTTNTGYGVGTAISIPYDRIMGGGNLQWSIAATKCANNTSTWTAVVYSSPTPR